ncbi:inactive pancreatic lipase-related protein 1-like, partial [Glandiceps talaboti]
SGGQAEEVCYGDLGCFTNDPPYDNSPLLPQDPATVNVLFWLYTRNNPDDEQVIKRNDPNSLLNSNFDHLKDSKFIIHGWTNNGKEPWIIDIRHEFLNSEEDLNVFAVDWENGADQTYLQSVSNTQVVGAEVDAFIRFLDTTLEEYLPSKVHLIGFSLGAHCSGHAGERSPEIGRVTGLDPAGENFEDEDPAVRLDPNDAAFVDVLHTDGGPTDDDHGIKMPCGDADFYPNGGEDQPGCIFNICDHGRCLQFFNESINGECKFTAYPCQLDEWFTCPTCCNTCDPECAEMGYHALPEVKGIFYLETNAESPFCQDITVQGYI